MPWSRAPQAKFSVAGGHFQYQAAKLLGLQKVGITRSIRITKKQPDRAMIEKSLVISEIYVPAKRRKTLDQSRVDILAEDILENGQTTPIQVRQGKGRVVLVEGLHRLEACKALGEELIRGYLVQARRY